MITSSAIRVCCGPRSSRLNMMLPGLVQISGSVGDGGMNRTKDVRLIQMALNNVSPISSGPSVRLVEDGLSGPKTISAIRSIQAAWTNVNDGRVDPNGPTLRQINQLAGAIGLRATKMAANILPNPDNRSRLGVSDSKPVENATGASTSHDPRTLPANFDRLSLEWQRAILRYNLVQTVSMPIASVSIVTALQTLVLAQQHIGSIRPGMTLPAEFLRSPERLAFLFVAKHFRLHESRPSDALVNIQRITAAFARMLNAFQTRTVSDENGLRFDRIFSLPVQVPLPGGISPAYVGMISGSETPNAPTINGEISDGIYLQPEFDRLSMLHVPIMLHELAHLSGGSFAIVDMSENIGPAFDATTTDQRMHNVRCYEFLATELTFGSSSTAQLYSIMNYGNPLWMISPPQSIGGGRLIAATPPAIGPDPMSFPGGFA